MLTMILVLTLAVLLSLLWWLIKDTGQDAELEWVLQKLEEKRRTKR